jgi:hypothetical protein
MSASIRVLAVAGALAAGVCEPATASQPPAHRTAPEASTPRSAPSAEAHGTPANFRSERGVGYSARTRRIADCLASFPRYDPGADRIEVRPGVSRPCPLPDRPPRRGG